MSKTKKQIVLHVGLPKTATTFLQLKVFPNIKNIFYTGNPNSEIFQTPFKHLRNINQTGFSLSVKTKIHEFINDLKQDKTLYSCEGMSGTWRFDYSNNPKNTEYLKEIFPEAKIFFVVRRQSDWLESIYRQVVGREIQSVFKKTELLNIDDFFNFKRNAFYRGKYMGVHNYDWFKWTQNYINKFGEKNVLVLPYEMLKANLSAFLKRFYDFTGYQAFYPLNIDYLNQQPEKYIIKAQIFNKNRTLNKFFGKFSKELNLSEQKISDNQLEIIKNLYKDTNKKFANLIKIDLSNYGYY